MATIKSYTDISQSKKLAEILPLESADGVLCEYDDGSWHYEEWVDKPVTSRHEQICWSLAALLDVLDRGALFKTPQGWACQSYIDFKAITSDYHSNPVDACYEMIIKLNKLNLL